MLQDSKEPPLKRQKVQCHKREAGGWFSSLYNHCKPHSHHWVKIQCRSCKGTHFKSAVSEAYTNQCSRNPVDWLCGHSIDKLKREGPVDALLCQNQDCLRWMYVEYQYQNGYYRIDLVDSGLSHHVLMEERKVTKASIDESSNQRLPEGVLNIVMGYASPDKSGFAVSTIPRPLAERRPEILWHRFTDNVGPPDCRCEDDLCNLGGLQRLNDLTAKSTETSKACHLQSDGSIEFVKHSSKRIVDVFSHKHGGDQDQIALVYQYLPTSFNGHNFTIQLLPQAINPVGLESWIEFSQYRLKHTNFTSVDLSGDCKILTVRGFRTNASVSWDSTDGRRAIRVNGEAVVGKEFCVLVGCGCDCGNGMECVMWAFAKYSVPMWCWRNSSMVPFVQ